MKEKKNRLRNDKKRINNVKTSIDKNVSKRTKNLSSNENLREIVHKKNRGLPSHAGKTERNEGREIESKKVFLYSALLFTAVFYIVSCYCGWVEDGKSLFI